jgi:hypothetical protein
VGRPIGKREKQFDHEKGPASLPGLFHVCSVACGQASSITRTARACSAAYFCTASWTFSKARTSI